ncbi:MAG: class I SAM-dependent methyltransferase [Bacteroidota bacterium]
MSGEIFQVWHCNDCELRFTQEIPIEEEIGQYYQSEEYISHSNTSKGIVNRLYQLVRDYTLIQKRKLVQHLAGSKTGKILDIGCGTGEFLGTMKQAGWNALGLEPDPGAREQANKNFGLTVEPSDHLFAISDSYDVISMWHVLEHVHQLHENIDQIYSLLKEDGVLLIAVPNYQSLDAGYYQEFWAAYDVPRHLYHFSSKAMSSLMEAHQFQVSTIRKMPFDSFYVSLLSEKYKHGKLRLLAGFWIGLRSFLKAFRQADRCSSILYVIRKQPS